MEFRLLFCEKRQKSEHRWNMLDSELKEMIDGVYDNLCNNYETLTKNYKLTEKTAKVGNFFFIKNSKIYDLHKTKNSY